MNNTILIAIGLLIIASISVGIASITSVPTIVVYYNKFSNLVSRYSILLQSQIPNQ